MFKKLFILLSTMVLLFTGCGQTSKSTEKFYSLDEAYRLEYITQENLQTISNYLNNNLTPTEELDTKLEKNLKNDYLTKLKKSHSKASLDDINIIHYYGKYNDCIAVMITDIYTDYSDALREIVVSDVLFKYNNGNNIIIWKS